ncbi:MAG: GntR family transcriptional regulator [Anaerolineae bacterium]|nr:GntR family transcriptional regulator [Anaerolineae bacterium]MCI0609282.1 GntR family transcriptional regulator [Anaerolineae bacterium]
MANFPFQRLQADLAALIASTPAGQRLTSEPELAKQLGVSRATLREAMRTFETQGLIRRRQGSGTYVVGNVPVIDAGLEVLESLDTMARRMNLEIKVSDLHIEQVQADKETATGLDVPEGTYLTRVRRVMRADGRPAAYLIDTLPETILKPSDLSTEFSGSVLDFLITRGDKLGLSRAAISATNAPADVAKPLEIQRDDVLLQFVSQLCDTSGKVVDYSHSYFIPGYFHFHVNRRVGNG